MGGPRGLRSPRRVVICGGGVAGVEALLALRAHLKIGVEVHLVAPNRQFVYQPLAVAAPFDLAETHLFDLAEIAGDQSAKLHVDSLARVDPEDRRVRLASGIALPYDALVVAVGARRRDWLEGALHFGGAADVAAFRTLLERYESGSEERLSFVSPPGISWTLPLYELALLTASHLADMGVIGAELTVVTPETDPLAVFGPTASRMLRNLLADRGIALKAGTSAEKIQHGELHLRPRATLEVDQVVTLAQLEGPDLSGLPSDVGGFIAVDEHSRVTGLEDVYAAGDGTTFPVKQGGIATQQADAAAEAIAAQMGAAITPSPIRPTLRECSSPASPRPTCVRRSQVRPATPSSSQTTRSGGHPARSPAATWRPTSPAITLSPATKRCKTVRPRLRIPRGSKSHTTRFVSWRLPSPSAMPPRATSSRPCSGSRCSSSSTVYYRPDICTRELTGKIAPVSEPQPEELVADPSLMQPTQLRLRPRVTRPGGRPCGPAIHTAGLCKRYGQTLALDALELSVGAGEVYGYLGPNGSGKTTTIRLLLGLHRPSGGRAELFGLDAWRDPVAAHRRVAYVAGEPFLWPALTSTETFRVPGAPARGYRRRLPRRADRALPARHRQEGPRAVEGQPPEGAAGGGVRQPRRAADPRRADQRPGSADGGGLPRDRSGGQGARADGLSLLAHPQ